MNELAAFSCGFKLNLATGDLWQNWKKGEEQDKGYHLLGLSSARLPPSDGVLE